MRKWHLKGKTSCIRPLNVSVIMIIAINYWSGPLISPVAADDDPFRQARLNMVEVIRQDAKYTGRVTGRKDIAPHVLEAMATTSRHEFVPVNLAHRAYDNRPLPIGYGQTISQPYIVALMTDLLDIDTDDVVLEIGTGSGYQAAVLAALVKQVYTVEIIPPLAEQAAKRLEHLSYSNVQTRIGDGYYGWPEHAPFDAIIVTAAATHVPPPLIEQLKPGGKMVIPVGSFLFTQQLMLVEKDQEGRTKNRQILPVAFVPLTGKH